MSSKVWSIGLHNHTKSQPLYVFVCWGLTSPLNNVGHVTTVPACSTGTLTNVLPHRNVMPQTQDTVPHPS